MTLHSIFKRNGRKSASRQRMDTASRASARTAAFNHWQQNLGTPTPMSGGPRY